MAARVLDPSRLPAQLLSQVAGAELFEVEIGRSGALVAQVIQAGRQDRFVKVRSSTGQAGWRDDLRGEAERLSWLQGRLAVPEVLEYGTDGEVEWLLLGALEGSDATRPEHRGDPVRLVRLLAEGLRSFHETLDASECPFTAPTDLLVEVAGERVRLGLVDPGELQPLHQGLDPTLLYAHLLELRPQSEGEPVVAHGDYCVPNVMVASGRISGYLDLGRLGVADRYLDLSIAARSIAYNFGGEAVGPFFDAYGVEWPDLARIEFFVLLDELL